MSGLDLLTRYLQHEGRYQREFAQQLLTVARSDGPWSSRRLAALMLEAQLLAVPRSPAAEHLWWLGALGLLDDDTPDRVCARVLEDGYSTCELEGFIDQLHARLARRAWIHSLAARHAERFVLAARAEGLLVLGRYLFPAQEVVARIAELLDSSEPGPDMLGTLEPEVRDEAERALSRLPAYEREITTGLRERARVWWVRADTRADAHGLVERPELSAALALTVPGSELELELKRAGMQQGRPLDIMKTDASGALVPPEHRLWGASRAHTLRFEARAGTRFARLYRSIHEREAPIPTMLGLVSIWGLPHDQDRHIIRHFGDPKVYGPGFERMQEAVRFAVEAHESVHGKEPTPTRTSEWLARFFGYHAPAQALLCGTTAFRLDQLAAALGEFGEPSPSLVAELPALASVRAIDWRGRRVSMLDEALGGLGPLPTTLEAALVRDDAAALLRVATLRERADRIYLDLLAQLAQLWATALALRCHSFGESFAARNLGLRSQFRAGAWVVELISMDHDRLVVATPQIEQFELANLLAGTTGDLGWVRQSITMLGCIYHVSPELAARGRPLWWATLRQTHDRARARIEASAGLDGQLSEAFRSWSRGLDALARAFGRSGAVEGLKIDHRHRPALELLAWLADPHSCPAPALAWDR